MPLLIAKKRREIGKLGGRDNHTARVLTCISSETLELNRHVPNFLRGTVLVQQVDQLLFLLERFIQRHPNFERDEFGHLIRKGIRLILNSRHISHHSLGRHRSKGDDLGDRVTPVGFRNILNDFVSAIHTKIDVEVRHGDPLGIQESFKQQIVFDGV